MVKFIFNTLFYIPFVLMLGCSCKDDDLLIIRSWIFVGGKHGIPILEEDTIKSEEEYVISYMTDKVYNTTINKAKLDSFLLSPDSIMQNDKTYLVRKDSKFSCYSFLNYDVDIYELYIFTQEDKLYGLTLYYAIEEGPLLFLMGPGRYKYIVSKKNKKGRKVNNKTYYIECISQLFTSEDKLIFYK